MLIACTKIQEKLRTSTCATCSAQKIYYLSKREAINPINWDRESQSNSGLLSLFKRIRLFVALRGGLVKCIDGSEMAARLRLQQFLYRF